MTALSSTRRPRPLNRLRLLVDRGLTPANALDRACESHPDRALFHPSVDSGFAALRGAAITPRHLLTFAQGLGGVLRGTGMQPGDRVAVVKTNHVDYFFLALVIIRSGGVAVPVNPGLVGEQLEHYLRHTGCTIVLTDPATFAAGVGDPGRVPSVRTWGFPEAPAGFAGSHLSIDAELETIAEERPPAALDDESPVLIAHTSGTTGFPKGVVSTAGSLVAGIRGHYLDEPITTRNRTGIAGHFNHLVYHSGLCAALLSGMPVWTMDPADAPRALRTIERERLNFFFAFPDVFLRMYHEGIEGYDLSSMRSWIATADASHDVHMRAFCATGAQLRLFGRPIMRSTFIEVLGTSEVGAGALRRIRLPLGRARSDRLIGWPTPGGPKIRIVDGEGRRKPTGEAGRLEVRGPTLFAGYWDPETMRPAPRHSPWFWTGDVAYQDRLRRFHNLDRDVDVVRTRNGPLYTLPVEEVLLTHPRVGEAVVIALPHPQEGEVAVALVQPKPQAPVDSAELLRWACAQLDPRSPLADVVVVRGEDIPRGLTGKVLKRQLRERHVQHFAEPPRRRAAH